MKYLNNNATNIYNLLEEFVVNFQATTIPYYQMEKMGNLDLLPDDGFTIICQPINIYKTSAGWVRPMAILK